jgi:hypothetical protein
MLVTSALMSAGVLTGLSAAPAAAQPQVIRPATVHNCPSSTLCLYQNKDYNLNGGSQWNFAYSNRPHDTWIYVGDAANDQATSLVNNRTFESSFAENKIQIDPGSCADVEGNGGNESFSAGPADLSPVRWSDGSKMNDSISAVMLKSSNYTTCNVWFPHG